MKRITRKALSLLLSFAVLLGMTQGADFAPAAAQAAGVTDSGGVTVYYCDSGLYQDSDCKTPFSGGQETVTNVVVRDGTMSIGSSTFNFYTSLTGISIPASVTSIGDEAFFGCKKLNSVALAEGSKLQKIGNEAFCGCASLQSIFLPASVTSIGVDAFFGCKSLGSIAFGTGSKLEKIGAYAFWGCTSLQSILLPASVTSIGSETFVGCTELTEINVENGNSVYSSSGGVLYSNGGKTLYCCPDGKTGAFSVPDGVTSIDEKAFECCANLTGIEIPASVTSVSEKAFYGCTGLKSVALIPPAGFSIADKAFEGCVSLKNLYIVGDFSGALPKVANLFRFADNGSGGYKLTNYTGTKAGILVPTSLYGKNISPAVNPGSLTQSVTKAYYNGSDLYRDETCKTKATDDDRTLITDIVVIEGVNAIGLYAFHDCTSLTGITIPDSVTSIGEGTFYNCSSLTKIAIPVSVTSIGTGAFLNCTGLTEIDMGAGNAVYSSNGGVLYSNGGKTLYCYPGGKSGAFSVPDSVTSIDEAAFECCANLTDVAIPASVTSIGAGAFYECTGLTRVTIPASVAGIGKSAFQYCTKLTGVILKGTTPPKTGNDAFDEGQGGTVTFIVPAASVEDYKNKLTPDVMGDTAAVVVGGKLVTAISGLPGAKTVANGTAQKDLNLPSSLTVTVDGKPETVAVTWISVPEYNPVQAGSYTFTPVLPAAEGYLLADGVGATVSITVKQPAAIVSGATGTPSLPSAVTDSPSGAQVVLSGATLPPGVTNISLSVTPETANGTQATPGTSGGEADAKGAAAFHLVISTPGLNIIGTPLLYNIKLLDQNGNPITGFNGKVIVKIPIPAGLHGTPRVFRYEESAGTLTDLGATVQDGFLVFSTDHFSYYVVAGTGNSITLDTKSYQMPVNGQYQIGLKLTGSKAAAVKFHSTSDKIATVAKLKNGNYQVTGKGTGTVWIMFDVYDSKNKFLTHASVRVDVKTGIKPRGDSTRQTGIF